MPDDDAPDHCTDQVERGQRRRVDDGGFDLHAGELRFLELRPDRHATFAELFATARRIAEERGLPTERIDHVERVYAVMRPKAQTPSGRRVRVDMEWLAAELGRMLDDLEWARRAGTPEA